MIKKIFIIIMIMESLCCCLATETITLRNDRVTVIINPELGRIVDWHLNGKKNVLWKNHSSLDSAIVKGWKNYGGDKVWLVQQTLRSNVFGNGAPDPDLDGAAWKVLSHNHLEVSIQSRESRHLHCRITRTIRLDPNKPELTIFNQVKRNRPSPYPVHLWSVSQTRLPERVFINQATDLYPTEPRFRVLVPDDGAEIKRHGNILEVSLHPSEWNKLNCWGRQMAAVIGDSIFIQSVDYRADASYPEGSNMQFYVNSSYAELEILSGLCQLPAGHTLSNTVKWQLVERSPGLELKQIQNFMKDRHKVGDTEKQ